MLSQLTQEDLINLKQEIIEIEMSSVSHPIEKQTGVRGWGKEWRKFLNPLFLPIT